MKVVVAKVNEVYFDGEADSLTLPGSDGVMTVLPKHEPLITTLKQGTITVRFGEQEKEFQIEGGMAEIRRDGVTVIL